MTAPVPNTGPAKFLWAGGGLAAGSIAAYGIKSAFVSPKRDKELEQERGTTRTNSSEMRYKAFAASFGIASGITLGLSKFTPTAGLTTATGVAMAALLSSVASGMNNPDRSDASMQNLGLMMGGVGVGALAAVRDETAHLPLRSMSLGLAGVAIGLMAPSLIQGLSNAPGEITRGITEK